MADILSEEDKDFLAKMEEELKDRYTEKDEEFMKVFNMEQSVPPIVENWWVSNNSGRRNNRYNPYNRHGNRDNRDRGNYGDRSNHGDRSSYGDRREGQRGYNDHNRGYNDYDDNDRQENRYRRHRY